ncbi:MAG TPA: DNA-3-methyladenine glycosylase 2 family protein [Acidocella sp.]|jgi:DNA-3-methyladenine glycosylase II|uniref:DNA-3-methyladenine glycosylase family protein n=1 Tax=Acidocella sp. TaxID=50710 RepID=UPI002C81B8B2|nr:DNA-3-methyladenine glycosylase 2 family protein [Acidocella sp.]HVE20839.1 DNA-3-methyladenine glycosylase 2 family protein [Acidocella sp.]
MTAIIPDRSGRPTRAQALAHIAAADPVLGTFIATAGPLTRAKPEFLEPYHALLSAVAHQQLHARAALAILGRLKSLSGDVLPAPAALLSLPDDALRGCGFSGAKIAAMRDVAAKAAEGLIPNRARAMRLSDEELIRRLVTIRGVGQWTVEMLLIFTLRRPDVLPVDDFGVREGYRLVHGLAAQPKPKAFMTIGQAFAPYRSTVAHYLWKAANLAKAGYVFGK